MSVCIVTVHRWTCRGQWADVIAAAESGGAGGGRSLDASYHTYICWAGLLHTGNTRAHQKGCIKIERLVNHSAFDSWPKGSAGATSHARIVDRLKPRRVRRLDEWGVAVNEPNLPEVESLANARAELFIRANRAP